MAGQLSTLHSDLFTASISYSWGWYEHDLRAGSANRHGEQRSEVVFGPGNAGFHAPYHDGAQHLTSSCGPRAITSSTASLKSWATEPITHQQ